ncbi:DrmB family protein [Agrobacterium radiobacter]|uniref:DrmB family protein n=1 Tax=Agrobacterium radiobacter TaxID=362 RepID=UPI003F85F235
MANNDLQSLRRSAVASLFGPGAIVDFRTASAPVSGMAAGLEAWDESFWPAGLANSQTIRETRLEKKLGVHGFRLPPVIEERARGENPDRRRLVAVRFPQWLQCPDCEEIGPERTWSADDGEAYRYCARCTDKKPGQQKVFAIPVRFVQACARGHVDEFPWHYWVGHKPECGKKKKLTLKADGAGLAGLILGCPECSQSKSMDGIFSKRTWEHSRCNGHRHWLADGDEPCEEHPVAVQRGASNLYFPITQSALSIPPWSDQLQMILGDYWATLVAVEAAKRAIFIEIYAEGELGPHLKELKMTPAQLADVIERRLASYKEIDVRDLRPAEFRQFVDESGDHIDIDLEFEIRRESVPDEIQPLISNVVRAVRLREVRALTGFTRINPPGDPDAPEVAQLSKTKLPWLPAIEVRGEGIFLALNEKTLGRWEVREDVKSRAEECHELYRADWKGRYGSTAEPDKMITARYMLCHTLAHALMRQLTLECGYSSASLQERIYAASEEKMAGILIYTATTDSDGTLGGLQRQGQAQRIAGILNRAIGAMEWCSSDPLCISEAMGSQASFSHAACHSCVLSPETSCETFNCFLDRALLVGTPENPEIGYFSTLLVQL